MDLGPRDTRSSVTLSGNRRNFLAVVELHVDENAAPSRVKAGSIGLPARAPQKRPANPQPFRTVVAQLQ